VGLGKLPSAAVASWGSVGHQKLQEGGREEIGSFPGEYSSFHLNHSWVGALLNSSHSLGRAVGRAVSAFLGAMIQGISGLWMSNLKGHWPM
jgi:hypothetical protein